MNEVSVQLFTFPLFVHTFVAFKNTFLPELISKTHILNI